jgi:hypothetical protein
MIRIALVGFAFVLTTGGLFAKPPGLPMQPEGPAKELTPMEREFHTNPPAMPMRESLPTIPQGRPNKGDDFFSWLGSFVPRFSHPLGLAERSKASH